MYLGALAWLRGGGFCQGLIPLAAWQQSPPFLCSLALLPPHPPFRASAYYPRLDWSGGEKGGSGPSPARFPALGGSELGSLGRSLEPRMGSASFSKRGSLTPMLSRPPSWRSMQTKLSPSEHTSWVLQCLPGLIALPSSYIAEWPGPLRARVGSVCFSHLDHSPCSCFSYSFRSH